jgi:hypothetical protein
VLTVSVLDPHDVPDRQRTALVRLNILFFTSAACFAKLSKRSNRSPREVGVGSKIVHLPSLNLTDGFSRASCELVVKSVVTVLGR